MDVRPYLYARSMEEIQFPFTWDRAGLEAVGFEGFVPMVGMPKSLLPTEHGIYSVLRLTADAPTFLPDNPIKKARNKIYTVEDLASNWVDGAEIVYIGKAEGALGLYDRLGAFSRKSSSHSGGRSLWQLEGCDDLIVAWRKCSNAELVEGAHLMKFAEAHGGRLPFANRR